MTGRCRVGIGALVVLLALPGAAQAATKTVNMGIPPKAGGGFQKLGVDVNDFFPHGVTINKGDKIRFLPVGFHSFDLPPRGGDPLPLISPTVLLTAIITVVGALQSFAQIAVLTGGGPELSTTVLVYYVFQQAFEFNDIGYGSTLALMLLSFVMVLTLLQWQLRRKWVFHEQ